MQSGRQKRRSPPTAQPFLAADLFMWGCGKKEKEKEEKEGKEEIHSGSVSPGARRSNAMLDKRAERLAGQISDKVGEKGFAIRFWGFDRWTIAD